MALWQQLAGVLLLACSLSATSTNNRIDSHLKVIAMHQPPFSFRRLDGSWTGIEIRFLEIISRQLNFTFDVITAGTTIASPTASWTSSDTAVVVELASGVADLGVGGVHLTPETVSEDAEVHSVYPHSHDCGVFLSQASVALPRHRAIMGPFHWKVWLLLTVAYVFASLPLAVLTSVGLGETSQIGVSNSCSHQSVLEICAYCCCGIWRAFTTTVHRLHESFWDVFGTFTNAFTLGKGWRAVGVQALLDKEESERGGRKRRGSHWTGGFAGVRRKSSNASWISSLEGLMDAVMVGTDGLRLLVAFYWAFTVIVSALYTGSIIAFITLPVFPKPYETGTELLHAGFTWGTLASGDWAQWLRETDSPVGEQVRKLTARADAYGCGCRGMRLFPSAEKAIRAVEMSSGLAFLSSRSLLTYLIAHPASSHDDEEEEDESSFFSLSLLKRVVGKKRKGPVLAMSTECFLPFRLGFLVRGGPKGKMISEALKHGLLRAEQSGLLEKGRMDADVEVGAGEEQEVDSQGKVVSSSEKRWRALHANRLFLGGGFRLGHGVLTERVLSLDDVQGIFLLLGAGFAIAFFALFVEITIAKIKMKYCPSPPADEKASDWDSELSDDDAEEEDDDRDSYLLKKLDEDNRYGYSFRSEWVTFSHENKAFVSASAPASRLSSLKEDPKFDSKIPRRVKSSYIH